MKLDGVGRSSEIMQGRRGFDMIFELLKVTGVRGYLRERVLLLGNKERT